MNDYNLTEHYGVYGIPPLSTIPFYDPIQSTTIDVMHCVDLGVTNRIVNEWFKSCNFKEPYYQSKINYDFINSLIDTIKPPDTIPRSNRSLSSISNYKANLDLSKKLLNQFVKDLYVLYGYKQMMHNAHLLLHLPEVVKEVGNIQINGYIFENMNGILRNMCHGTNNVAKQILKKNQLHFESIMKLSSLSIVHHETKMKTIMKSPSFEDLINQRTGQTITHYLTIHYQNQLYTSKLYNSHKLYCQLILRF
ncbi:hypothetical protein BLOT_007359 [Blomia tropicalis]|nr:hypothetical protein BLOT_007359 [Blomia tropicalis]